MAKILNIFFNITFTLLLSQGIKISKVQASEEVFLQVYEAIENNDSKKVEDLLNKHKSFNINSFFKPNKYSSHKESLLFKAAAELNLEIVKTLVEKGANVDLGNSAKVAPLVEAAYPTDSQKLKNPNRIEIIKYLVKNKANVNAETLYKDNILHLITSHVHTDVELIKFLLENGADPNKLNSRGYAPVHLAADNLYLDILKILAEHKNTDLSVKTPEGKTAIDILNSYPYSSERKKVSKILENRKQAQFQTNLLYEAAEAIGNNETEKVISILNNNKNLNINEKIYMQQMTLLHEACERGNLELVKFLVQKGANINAKDVKNLMPLHYAVSWTKDLELIEFLVKNGAHINPAVSVLHEAFDLKVTEFLIEKGADINARTVYNQTLLHKAIAAQSVKHVEFLIERGANPNIKETQRGFKPLGLAAYYGNIDIIKLLVRYEKTHLFAKDESGRTFVDIIVDRVHERSLAFEEIERALLAETNLSKRQSRRYKKLLKTMRVWIKAK